jgi:outer membrane protease
MQKSKFFKTCSFLFYYIFLIHTCIAQDKNISIYTSVSSGFATEKFSWNIAGNLLGENPNVLSELQWNNLTGIVFKAEVNFIYKEKFGLNVNFSSINYNNGDARDTDYNKDNRQEIVFDALLNGSTSTNKKFLIGINYSFKNEFNNWFFIPELGYINQTSNYKLTDDSNPLLNSNYNTNWTGLYAGFTTKHNFNDYFVSVNVVYNQLDYIAEAEWNLIDIFKQPLSFVHNAKGYMLSGSVKIGYNLNKKTALFFEFLHQKQSTGKGVEILYLKDNTTKKTRVNDVSGNNNLFTLGVKYQIL